MDPFTLALIGGGTSLLGGGLSFLGSQSAGKAQQQAAQISGMYGLQAQQQAQQMALMMAAQGAAAGKEYYGKGREDVLSQAGQGEAAGREFYGRGVGYQEPYMGAGAGATNQLAALFAPGGEYTRQPTLEELQMDPGYAFRFREGQRALEQSAAARGGLLSGGAGKALARYGQEAGSQEYQNAYARFMANRAAATQGLQNLAGVGASAANTASGLAGQIGSNLMAQRFGTGANLGTLASNVGGTVAGAYTGAIPTMAALTSANPMGQAYENMGQARASSYMGGANALSNALTGVGNSAMLYGMMDRMYPTAGGAVTPRIGPPMQLSGGGGPIMSRNISSGLY